MYVSTLGHICFFDKNFYPNRDLPGRLILVGAILCRRIEGNQPNLIGVLCMGSLRESGLFYRKGGLGFLLAVGSAAGTTRPEPRARIWGQETFIGFQDGKPVQQCPVCGWNTLTWGSAHPAERAMDLVFMPVIDEGI